MFWLSQTPHDSSRAINERHERLKRERAEELKRLNAETDAAFLLIRSNSEPDRLEGYRQHLHILGRQHRFTITFHDSSGGHADWSRRSIHMPHLRDEAAAAVGYHEVGHVLEGACPNDGTAHRRDPTVKEWWHCVRCETLATSRALTLGPFTRPMFDRLARGLRRYRASTPASAAEVERLDRLAGTITFAEHQQRWRKWWDRIDRQAQLKGRN